jgi:hypothetical protein
MLLGQLAPTLQVEALDRLLELQELARTANAVPALLKAVRMNVLAPSRLLQDPMLKKLVYIAQNLPQIGISRLPWRQAVCDVMGMGAASQRKEVIAFLRYYGPLLQRLTTCDSLVSWLRDSQFLPSPNADTSPAECDNCFERFSELLIANSDDPMTAVALSELRQARLLLAQLATHRPLSLLAFADWFGEKLPEPWQSEQFLITTLESLPMLKNARSRCDLYPFF